VVAYLIVNVHVLNYQSYLLLGVVTYSRVSRRWEVFFPKNRSWEFAKKFFNSVIETFWEDFCSVKNILKTE